MSIPFFSYLCGSTCLHEGDDGSSLLARAESEDSNDGSATFQDEETLDGALTDANMSHPAAGRIKGTWTATNEEQNMFIDIDTGVKISEGISESRTRLAQEGRRREERTDNGEEYATSVREGTATDEFEVNTFPADIVTSLVRSISGLTYAATTVDTSCAKSNATLEVVVDDEDNDIDADKTAPDALPITRLVYLAPIPRTSIDSSTCHKSSCGSGGRRSLKSKLSWATLKSERASRDDDNGGCEEEKNGIDVTMDKCPSIDRSTCHTSSCSSGGRRSLKSKLSWAKLKSERASRDDDNGGCEEEKNGIDDTMDNLVVSPHEPPKLHVIEDLLDESEVEMELSYESALRALPSGEYSLPRPKPNGCDSTESNNVGGIVHMAVESHHGQNMEANEDEEGDDFLLVSNDASLVMSQPIEAQTAGGCCKTGKICDDIPFQCSDNISDSSMDGGIGGIASAKQQRNDSATGDGDHSNDDKHGMRVKSTVILRTRVVPGFEVRCGEDGEEVIVDSISVKIKSIARKLEQRRIRGGLNCDGTALSKHQKRDKLRSKISKRAKIDEDEEKICWI